MHNWRLNLESVDKYWPLYCHCHKSVITVTFSYSCWENVPKHKQSEWLICFSGMCRLLIAQATTFSWLPCWTELLSWMLPCLWLVRNVIISPLNCVLFGEECGYLPIKLYFFGEECDYLPIKLYTFWWGIFPLNCAVPFGEECGYFSIKLRYVLVRNVIIFPLNYAVLLKLCRHPKVCSLVLSMTDHDLYLRPLTWGHIYSRGAFRNIQYMIAAPSYSMGDVVIIMSAPSLSRMFSWYSV